MSIPKGTTHVWTCAVDEPRVSFYIRLPYFKKTKSGWWVYSDVTGWRPTSNSKEWFEEEKKSGYFVTINKYNSPNFTPKKESL